MTSDHPRLVARHASKTYGPAKVLVDAGLEVQPGEIHALIGQNGSGKSTLVKILTGYHSPDRGMELAVDGVALAVPVQWRSASSAGVSVVHQDLGLLEQLTVSENIGVGGFVHSRWSGKINWKRQTEVAKQTLSRLGLDIDPNALVGSLPASRRAEVAIARALRDIVPGKGVVLLDEATRSLPRDELEHFHTLMRRIAATGTSIIMVSHNLDEVLSVSTKVTVLRDGRVAGAGLPTSTLDETDLARLMLGQTVNAVVREAKKPQKSAHPAAKLEQVILDGHLALDLTIHAGEVVGVTGLPGTGFEGLTHLLAGGQRGRGTLTTKRGRLELARTSVQRALHLGVAMVPERRIDEGLAVELPIGDNLALPSLRRKGRPWFVARNWQRRLAQESIIRFGIKAPDGDSLVKELSGGNQQKVLLAKWLSVEPTLLVLHEPTQAVDVGARADLLQAIGAVADQGAGVLLVSTEPTDLAEICDRVLVMHPGRNPIELCTRDPEELLDAIYSEHQSIGAPSA